MTVRKPRTIKLGSISYLWRVHHRHRAASDGNCAEVFSAFHGEHPRKPVRIIFPESSEHGPGYPSQRGVLVDNQQPNVCLNLNRPVFARLLIELAIAKGWSPATTQRELVIENGYHLLRKHQLALNAALANDREET